MIRGRQTTGKAHVAPSSKFNKLFIAISLHKRKKRSKNNNETMNSAIFIFFFVDFYPRKPTPTHTRAHNTHQLWHICSNIMNKLVVTQTPSIGDTRNRHHQTIQSIRLLVTGCRLRCCPFIHLSLHPFIIIIAVIVLSPIEIDGVRQ